MKAFECQMITEADLIGALFLGTACRWEQWEPAYG